MSEEKVELLKVEKESDLPKWAPRKEIVDFFHYKMKPYEDLPKDIEAALDYLFSDDPYAGGFLMLAKVDGKMGGLLAMLNTGMGGYVPENILLFVSVDPALRGRGIGRQIIEGSIAECQGDVKLHVEYDNPAKRLYERVGFTTKYAEMRYENK